MILTNQQKKAIKDKIPQEIKHFLKDHIKSLIQQNAYDLLNDQAYFDKVLQEKLNSMTSDMI